MDKIIGNFLEQLKVGNRLTRTWPFTRSCQAAPSAWITYSWMRPRAKT